MKVKLLGVLDGRNSQLHALATLFAPQIASVSNGLEAGVDVGHRICPSINYCMQKCHR
jgi:hypothetical protein